MASKKQNGRIDPALADSFNEADIERQALEDGEDAYFDRDAPPNRVESPYPRKRTAPVR